MANDTLETTQADESASSKSLPKEGTETPEIEQGNEAVLLRVDDAERGGHHLKLAKDGHTVLVPQPSADPNDPLNWSWGKKHMMLFIVALSAFCGDFGSGAGIPCIVVQYVVGELSLRQLLTCRAEAKNGI